MTVRVEFANGSASLLEAYYPDCHLKWLTKLPWDHGAENLAEGFSELIGRAMAEPGADLVSLDEALENLEAIVKQKRENYEFSLRDPVPEREVVELDPETAAAWDRLHPAPTRLRVPIDWPSFWTEEYPAQEWALEPLVPTGGQVSLFSQAKAGKSLLVLEWAVAAVAAGKLRVLYVDQEMTRVELRDRLESFGYGPQSDLSGLIYFQLQRYLPLDSPEGGDEILEDALEHHVDLVIIDTACRVVDGEEDRADTWQAFYRNTGLGLKNARIGLLRLDHAGKDKGKGARGSSAKNDDVDGVFLLEVVAEDKAVGTATIKLTNTHRRGELLHDLTVKRTRTDDGLTRHVLVQQNYVSGTAAVAAQMDRLEVPVNISDREAERQFRAAGGEGRTTTIRDALKYRKSRVPGRDAPPTGRTPGRTPTHDAKSLVNTRTHPRTHPDAPPASASPPLEGDARAGQGDKGAT